MKDARKPENQRRVIYLNELLDFRRYPIAQERSQAELPN